MKPLIVNVFTIRPKVLCKTAQSAMQNGPKCTAKWAVSEDEMGRFARRVVIEGIAGAVSGLAAMSLSGSRAYLHRCRHEAAPYSLTRCLDVGTLNSTTLDMALVPCTTDTQMRALPFFRLLSAFSMAV